MGVSLAVSSVLADVRGKGLRRILGKLGSDIESGLPFWKALEQTKFFNASIISLVRIGEDTGRLSENLRLVSLQEEKEQLLQSKLRSAMIYPLFVLVLTISIGIGIAWFILPELARVFSQLHMNLPLITKALIAFGTFLGDYGSVAIPSVIFFLFLTIFLVFFFRKTRFIGQAILLFIPGTRQLVQGVELSRFGYLLGTLLGAGVPISESLDSLVGASTFSRYRKLYEHLARSIRDGNSFEESFLSYRPIAGLVPTAVRQLVATGERSGSLPETFLRISEMYETKTEATTKNLTVMLEPVLLVLVWIGVVSVALAVILPIYSLIGELNTTGKDASPQTEDGSVVLSGLPENIVAPEAGAVVPQVRILEILPTGTGFLNVRNAPGAKSKILGRAKPGDTYEYRSNSDGWFEIFVGVDCDRLPKPCVLPEGYAWISEIYAKPKTQNETGIYAP